MTTITLESRMVYGKKMTYPVGETSRYVRDLTGNVTLSDKQIKALLLLGFNMVEQKTESVMTYETGRY
jgi:uncharacterized protein (DUF2252 family)